MLFNMLKIKQLFTYILCGALIACATVDSSRSWPENIPSRAFFVDIYHQTTDPNPSMAMLERHLTWIKRFYQGSMLYPLGWNRMTELLVASMPGQQDKQEAAERLYNLGKRISVEWAQDNHVRNIDSSNVATWGNALKTSAERMEQIEFIGRVEQDVEDLIARRLDPSEITRERYYPPDDYDNF